MYYLLFRPFSRRIGNSDRLRYDYRQQNFVGFTENFEEALKMAYENLEANYQIYETEQTLNFSMRQAVRYGFRHHYGVVVPYRRRQNGREEIIPNPLESEEENERRMKEIGDKRLEGIQKRISELKEVEGQLKSDQDS